MARKHVNDDGQKLDCSTTPENCDFSGNAGHIDENSTPEEVAEFNRKAEEISQQAALRQSKKASVLGTSKRKPKRPNNDELIELDDYTLAEAKEREITMDRMAMNHDDIYDVRKRNNGKWSPAISPESKSSFSDLGIAEEKHSHARRDYERVLEKHPGYVDPSTLEGADYIAYSNYHATKKELNTARKEHLEELNTRKRRHLNRLLSGELKPKDVPERKHLRLHRMKEGSQQTEKWLNRDKNPEHVASIENKHFNASGHGSKFTVAKNPSEVIGLANLQRTNLQGDDRDKLIAAGADPDSFLSKDSGVRYLMVETPGTESVIDTSTMNDDDKLTIVAKGKNDGRPPSLSFVADVEEQPKTNIGTIIVGPEKDQNGDFIPDSEMVWTMHPGSPTRGIRSNTVREKGLDDGDTLTVKEFREKFGQDIKANTRLTD